MISGNKWVREDGTSRQERITPEDRRHIGKALAFRGGAGSAAASPESTEGRGRATDRFGGGGGLLPKDDTLKDDTQLAQTMLNPASQVAPMGHVSGSLQTATWGPSIYNSTFSFDVNLASGQISNGTMNLNPGAGSLGGQDGVFANLSGGTGQANVGGFTMSGASGMGILVSGGTPMPPERMTGAVYGGTNGIGLPGGFPPLNLQTAPSGTTFPVDYRVYGAVSGQVDIGFGTGSIAK